MTEEEARKIAEETAARLKSHQDPPASSDPPKEPDRTNYEQLFTEGRYDEAVAALRRETRADLAPAVATAIGAAAASARREFMRELGDDAGEWMPEIEKLATEFKIDLNTLVTLDQWKEAYRFTQGKNIDKVLERERSKMRREYEDRTRDSLPPIAGGSGGGADDESRSAYGALEASERRMVDALGFDPKRYRDNKKLVEAYREQDGAVTDLPVMDDDLDFAQTGRDRVIPPGKF